MMKTITYFMFFCALFFANNILAKPYYEGWYLTPQRDTIYGLIKEDRPYLQGDYFSFKENDLAKSTDIGPNKAIAYFYKSSTNNYFLSKSFKLPEAKIGQQQFVRVWVKGQVSFYTFTGKDKKKHYLVESEAKGLQVIPTKTRVVNDKKITDNSYLAILQDYLGSCPTVDRKIRDTRFDRNILIELVTEFNSCDPEQNDLEKTQTYRQTKEQYMVRVYGGLGYFYYPDLELECRRYNLSPYCTLEDTLVYFQDVNNLSYNALVSIQGSPRSVWKLNAGAVFRQFRFEEKTQRETFFSLSKVILTVELEAAPTIKKIPWLKPFFNISISAPLTFKYENNFVIRPFNQPLYGSISLLRGGLEVNLKKKHFLRLTTGLLTVDFLTLRSTTQVSVSDNIQLSYGFLLNRKK